MGALRRILNDQWFVALVGLCVCVLALIWVGQSVRAGLAQWFYYHAKYGKPVPAVDRLNDLCRRAYTLYPHNYYFSTLAAETAYSSAQQSEADVRRQWIQDAAVWCERGLRQNWWKSQMRRLKARLLWATSPSESIRFWKTYVDWHYWEPYNHAVLAEMYGEMGDFEMAESTLALIRDTREGDRGRMEVERLRKEWGAVLEKDGERWGE